MHWKDQLWISPRWLALTATLLTLLLYFPVSNNNFLNFDDNKLIYENTIITNGSYTNLDEIVEYQRFQAHYKPLVIFFWNLEYQLWGDNPKPYFINNILLHTSNTLLVFLVVLLLSKQITPEKRHQYQLAFFSALLFGLHPMSVESVAWATERKDVQFGFFMLGAYYSYLRAKFSKPYRIPLLLLSSLLFTASVFSKSPAIMLLPILVITDLFLNEKCLSRENLLNKIPFLIIFMLAIYNYGLLTNFSAQAEGITAGLIAKETGENAANIKDLPGFLRRILLINYKFWFWIGHLLIPVKLAISYPRKELIEMVGALIYITPLLSAGLVFIMYRLRTHKWLWFGMLFFVFSLAPALAISDVGTGIFVSDRYTYIPSIGLFFVVLMCIFSFPASERNKTIIILILTATYATGMVQYRSVWKNSATLFSDVINKYPNQIPVAYNNLGLYYKNERNELDKASRLFQQSIQIDPSYHNAYTNLGNTYFHQQAYKKAIPVYNKLLAIRPGTAEAYSNRGASYSQLGKPHKALADFDTAISLNPRYIDAYSNRALIRLNTQQYDLAIEDFDLLIQWLPANPTYINARGVALQKKGLYQESLKDFNRAIEFSSENKHFYLNRTQSHYHLKNYRKALQDVQKAQSLGATNINEAYIARLQQLIQNE